MRAYEVDVEDICYRRVDGHDLLARLYRPRGAGPFPGVVGVHGGVWTAGSRASNEVLDSALARSGVVVVALDVRKPPAAGYPAAVVDVREGTRWLQGHAAVLGVRPEGIAAVGTSSGGHLVLLAALRDDDPATADEPDPPGGPGEVGRVLRALVLCWPVVDPPRRYRWAHARGMDLVARQLRWFGTEAAMAAGSPQRMLERWSGHRLPPMLLVQGSADANLPSGMAERFVETYRRAGGAARLMMRADAPHGFALTEPESAAARTAVAEIVGFVHLHTVETE